MSMISLSQIIGGNQRDLYKIGENVRSAVSKISAAADQGLASLTGADTADVTAQRIQARYDGFREAARNIASDLSELAYAGEGVEDIGSALEQLQTLAQDSLDVPLDSTSREKLNKKIAALRDKIDTAAKSSGLAPATVAGDAGKTSAAEGRVLPQLSSKLLLGAKTEITSSTDIRNLLTTTQNAMTTLQSASKEIKNLQDSAEMMATHLEISMENQLAAGSMLPVQGPASLLDALLSVPQQSVNAQTGHMPSELLNLL